MEQPDIAEEAPPRARSHVGFRPDIEGLRAVAILAVVLFHADVPGFAGGFVGVDVFFVLSGYLISRLIAKEVGSSGRLSFLQFYARRARRLLPASSVMVACTLGLGVVLLGPLELRALARTAAAVAAYGSNVLFASTSTAYLGSSLDLDPLLHTWSLAVEEQFYFVWPLLLFGLVALGRRIGSRRVTLGSIAAIAGASFVACVVMTSRAQPLAFFLVPFRFWEFALGALVGLAAWRSDLSRRASGAAGVVGLIMVLLAVFVFDKRTVFPGAAAVVPVVGTGLILLSGQLNPTAPIARALSVRPMQRIGRLSYSWYLWHWPLLVFLLVLAPRAGVLAKVLVSAGALGLAALTFRFVEDPVRRCGRFERRPLLTLVSAGVLALVMFAVSGAVFMVATHSASTAAQRRFVKAEADNPVIYDSGCVLDFADVSPAENCVFGSPSGKRIVLFGDSHAAHWFPAARRVATELGAEIDVQSKAGCPPAMLRTLFNDRMGRPYTECPAWRRKALDRIRRMRPDLVVLSGFSAFARPRADGGLGLVSVKEWGLGVRRTVEQLVDAGIPVLLIHDVPASDRSVPRCLSTKQGALVSFTDCTFPRTTTWSRAVQTAERRAIGGLDGAGAVSLNAAVCPGQRCEPVRDGVVTYRDYHHLTATWSERLTPVLLRSVRQAISGGS